MSQLRSISQLTVVNVIGLGVTALDSIVTAQYFGTSKPMRDYFAAITLLVVVQKVFMVGQFSDVFLPQYVKIREVQGLSMADRCFSALYNHIMLSLVLAGVVFIPLAPLMSRLIAPGFSVEAQEHVAQLSLGLLPSVLLVVANGHLQIVGNARGWYGRFTLYGVVGNALGLIAMVATAHAWGVWAVVLSQNVTQLVMLAMSLHYLAKNGYRHAWVLRVPGFSPWAVSARVAITGVYVVTTQWYTIVFNAALSYLPNNALSVYKYAESLYVKTSVIFMRPVSVVFFTDASVLAHHNPGQLRTRISHALYHYALFYAGVLAVVFPAVPNLLGALWGGSQYNARDIDQTTYYLCCLYGLLILDAVGLIYRRLNMVVGDLLWQYMAMSVVQVIMALIVPSILNRLQVNGVPMVLAVNVVLMLLSTLVVHARRKEWQLAFFPSQTWKIVVAVIPPLLMVWLLPHWLPWFHYAGDISLRGKLLEVLKSAVMSGLGLGMLVVAVLLLKIEEAEGAWRWLRGFLQRKMNGIKAVS